MFPEHKTRLIASPLVFFPPLAPDLLCPRDYFTVWAPTDILSDMLTDRI
jgi:hypothetical protein